MSIRENKLSLRFLVAVALAAATAAGAVLASTPRTKAEGGVPISQDEDSRVRDSLRRLPLSFEKNVGQAHSKVRFLSRGSGYTFMISPTASYIGLAKLPKAGKNGPQIPADAPASFVSMRLLYANSNAPVVGDGELPGRTNYLVGSDQSAWKRDISTFDKVRVKGAYPGVDVVYYGNQQELEHDFVLAPGADPKQILLQYDNVKSTRVDANGELVLTTSAGEIRQRAPVAYQDINGRQEKVSASYRLYECNIVSFTLGDYDRGRTLIIDPILRYSTYIGGTFDDYAFSIVLDADRNAYITGYTGSFQQDADGNPSALPQNEGGPKLSVPNQLDYPQVNPLQQDPDDYTGLEGGCGGRVGFDYTEANPAANNPNTRHPDAVFRYGLYDAFVTKLNNNGTGLIYSTYLGAENDDYGLAISIDQERNAYVTGSTRSIFWTLINPVQTSNGGGADAFVVKITPGGNGLIFSTYLGGSGTDLARAIVVDNTGNTHIAGLTTSTDFPVFAIDGTPHQATFGGGANDAFVASLDASGSAYNYSTYFGGNGDESGIVAAVVPGLTFLARFLTLDPVFGPQPWTTIIDRGDQAGGDLEWPRGPFFCEPLAAHLGADVCIGLAVDTLGNAYLTGGTTSTNLNGRTTTPSFQSAKSTATDGYVVKFDPSGDMGNAFPGTYFTFLGGNGDEAGRSVAVDLAGNAHVTGYTRSTNFPAFVPGGASSRVQGTPQGGTDAFMAKFNNTGSDLVHSAYLGGSGEDMGHGIAVSAGGQAYVTGHTSSSNFPTKQFLQSTLRGGRDVFVTKYRPDLSDVEYSTYMGSFSDDRGVAIAIDNRGQAYVTGHTNAGTFPVTANRVMNFSSRSGANYGPTPDSDVFVAYLFAPPFAPSNLVVVDLQQTSITLAWTDNADNEDGYEVERKLGTASSSNPFTLAGRTVTNVVTFQDTGLSPSTTYTYRVRGFNNDGTQTFYGPYSNQVTAETLPDIPGTPTGLTATPIDTTRIKLDWTDNSNNEASFKIERRRITAPTTGFVEIRVTAANAVTFTDTGLTANTTYEYRIRSSNSAGDSPYEGPVQATTLPNKPTIAPTGLTATAVSNSQIDLSWTYTRTDTLGFKIDRSTDGTNFTPLRTTATPNVTTFGDLGLPSNTTYFYRVRAYNQSGDGPNSAVANATTLPDPPADPTNLILKLNGTDGVVGTWNDNSSNESGFRVEESTDDFATVSFAFDTPPNVTSFQRVGLQLNTIYSYRVTAFALNAGGRSNSQNSPEGRILLRPATPSGLTVASHAETTIDLEWDDNNPVGPSTFKVERSPGFTINFVEIASVTASTVGGTVTYQDSGLTPNTNYRYRVRAFNTAPLGVVGGGVSAYTSFVTQFTRPAAAVNLSAAPVTGPPPQTWVLLTWTDPNAAKARHHVQRRRITAPAESGFNTIADLSTGVATYTDQTSLGNVLYQYRVVAFNAGPSGDGAPSNVVDQLTLPTKPADLKAVVPTTGVPRRGRTQIDLTWTDKSGAPTQFEIWQSTDNLTFFRVGTNAMGDVTFTATGLVENTLYYFKVRGVNGTGVGDFTSTVSGRTLKAPPAEPTGLTATVRNDVEILLTWEDNSSNEDGFRVERKTDTTPYVTAVTVGPNVKSSLIGGLAPSTTYAFRVIAFNNGGDSTPSRTAGGRTAPAAPTNLTLTNITPTSIIVRFTDNATEEEGFKLERQTGTGAFIVVGTVAPKAGSGAAHAFNNTGLTSGVKYTYRVRAYKGTLFSRYSNTASATTP